MKNINILFFFILLGAHAGAPLQINAQSIVANPIDLNYRFQFDEPSYREAADPVCEYFQGKYYLFASHSGGYWSSPDLAKWTYIPCTTIAEIENYAPSILVRNDSLYYIASGSKIYSTAHPEKDEWQQINTKFNLGVTDPAFFQDNDGKVYLYWGCSDKDPIKGVEVNPLNGFAPIGQPATLITHNQDKYGWEIQGENNELGTAGWNEGPCMIKYKGKYYLQYASPGTQFRIYADGVYVSENPLGPYTYMENSPFSLKPGGFIGGAGHGHTFLDKYGNYWHVATMKISKRHMFERRLGLFPLYITEDNTFGQHTIWTDYPFAIPDKKTDFETDNCSMNWNLLSFGKPASASSSLSILYAPGKAANEEIENWWSAQTGNAGEWWQIDLGKPMQVNAIQVNFADQDFTVKAPGSYVNYQYKIENSGDGENWTLLVDRTQNTLDKPHELIVLDTPQSTRYLRITNTKNMNGKFSISGFRVFGNGGGERPQKVSGIQAKRKNGDPRRFLLTWDKQEDATGYIVHWGVKENQLTHEAMVFTNQLEAGYFNRDSRYYFSVDAFNENGITKGTTVTEGIVFFGTPYKGTPYEVPGTIEAEDFNEGGQSFAYYDTTKGNSFLEYRDDEGVDIAYYRRTKAYYLANTATGEFTNYTIQVPKTGVYDFDCVGSSVQANAEGGFYLSFNGEKPANPSFKTLPAGSLVELPTTTLTDLFLAEGVSVMTFNMKGDLYVDKFIFRESGTGLHTLDKPSVSVYPNPSAGIFNIKTPQTAFLTVADMTGQKVYSDRNFSSSYSLDLTKEPKGIYLLSLQTDDRICRTKLIKN